MDKYRIVQAKPSGLTDAFELEQLLKTPAHTQVNQKYSSLTGYYESISKFNAAGLPKDYYITIEATESWESLGNWYFTATLDEARKSLESLMSARKLEKEAKTFKRVVIEQHD